LAFTLIEMLAVMAIIGLLIGLLLPSIAAVRGGATAQKTKLQLHALVTALSDYATHYGSAPDFLKNYQPVAINSVLDDFLPALQGTDGNGAPPQQNPDNVRFYVFNRSDFDGGGRLVDASGSGEIYAMARRPNYLTIPRNDFPENVRGSVPNGGVAAPFAIWSLLERNRLLTSW
jgi:prepilin-type N-terminal cleavage/methylation domain-containing protein